MNIAMKGLQWGSWEIGGPGHYYREDLIIKTIKSFLPSGKIFDVGCGTGSLVLKLAREGYQVEGVDISDECVSITKSRIKEAGLSKSITISQGSATKIDLPDRCVDGVIAGEVLEHLQDDGAAVCEFSRILKVGGVCIITVPANPALWNHMDEMAGHVRRYTRDDLVRLFSSQKFKFESIRYWGFPIMRIYHKLLCITWAKITVKRQGLDGKNLDTITKIGLSGVTTIILGNIFRFDDLFARFPWGIGIVFVAKKI